MTTIITKHGNGVPTSLQVGELAIDKSEPALYTNTGGKIEKIGGGSGGSSLGGGGVLWGATARYKDNGFDKYVLGTLNGQSPNLLLNTVVAPAGYYCVGTFLQNANGIWAVGDNTVILKPTALGGNVVGFVPKDPPPSNLTRLRIFVDDRLIYDAPEMFEGNDDLARTDTGPIVGEEIKLIYTVNAVKNGGFEFGYLGAGIAF